MSPLKLDLPNLRTLAFHPNPPSTSAASSQNLKKSQEPKKSKEPEKSKEPKKSQKPNREISKASASNGAILF